MFNYVVGHSGVCKATRLSGNLIHGLGKLHVEVGQAAGIVGGECHVHRLVDIEPLRMVVHFFRDQRRARHEAEGLVEVLEHEFLRDGVAAARLRPAVKSGQRGFTGISGEFAAP